MNDTISDMLTRIRNANLAKHQIVHVPATKVTRNITKVLQKEGFIYQFEEIGKDFRNDLLISLKYKGKNREPIITELKRISKPGLKVYASHKELPKVLGGIGIAIISTSQGIMTDKTARQFGLGGEVLCYVW
uniref:Small ribosomal subunit protein uS8c n=1 Tax=Polysiphonia scopulorum TaxID=257860 RepID=A0A1Z1MHZ0_9FLOR|nr:ribosomal protein S8 [Polysiphonia scopulorum]ARW65643.1 ribosomal protein S8 [Polysiphonia scopulorum]